MRLIYYKTIISEKKKYLSALDPYSDLLPPYFLLSLSLSHTLTFSLAPINRYFASLYITIDLFKRALHPLSPLRSFASSTKRVAFLSWDAEADWICTRKFHSNNTSVMLPKYIPVQCSPSLRRSSIGGNSRPYNRNSWPSIVKLSCIKH